MLIYLDTVIVIYTLEGVPALMARADARLLTARSAGDTFATSDLTRLECSVQPLRLNKYSIADALHLAAATLGNCDRFLTNDAVPGWISGHRS